MLQRIISTHARVRTTAAKSAIRAFSATPATADNKCSVLFSVRDEPGALQTALHHFSRHGINLTHLESRPSKRAPTFDFFVDFDGTPEQANIQALLKDLREKCLNVTLMGSKEVPWFPRKLADMDIISANVLGAGAELESDHPGFHDPEYRHRRKVIAENAVNYKLGQPIPRAEYTKAETETWGIVWDRLVPLLKKHACSEYNRMLPLLMANCGYRANNIPQLQDISDFLKDCTGFTLRPVGGLLSARDFLNGLAFRVFFSTQYIRHPSKPLYTPEPDIVHELMGHAPLFADQSFADFSQEIGLASIGATDEQITELARCYWFSVEFGLCEQDGEKKAYGAGLLSSFGELEHSMKGIPEMLPWDPFVAAKQTYPITTFQPKLFVAKSFEDAKERMRQFSDSLNKPFHVRYNPLTQSLQVDRNIKVKGDAPAKPVANSVTM